MRSAIAITVGVVLLTHVAACLPNRQVRSLTARPSELFLDNETPFLKAHMRNGEAIVLSSYTVDTTTRTIRGTGVRYDINRNATQNGQIVVPMDSAVLYESNRVVPEAVVPLALMGGASLVGTAACAANPKACFGSCPTFYVQDGSSWRLAAEGFSSSVSPVLEATDVDALPSAQPRNGVVKLVVKNEAFETHNIRAARLLAVAHAPNETVYAGEHGMFWRSRTTRTPTACTDRSGSCLAAVQQLGGSERFTLTDSTDLAAREYITVDFPEVKGARVGLAIKARQSLVSTFLFYQALSYMGRNAGTWFAALERGDPLARKQAHDPAAALGGIEVQQRDETGEWVTVAETLEHGPIVSDLRVLPLPRGGESARQLRIRLASGAWRVDYLALVSLDEAVVPMRIEPTEVLRDGRVDEIARARLADSTRFLTTLPGDAYTLVYRVPTNNQPVALFLEARGFYLEWIRAAWLAEENPAKAAMMLTNPARAMRELAPAFKKLEPDMESTFWRSRYVPR